MSDIGHGVNRLPAKSRGRATPLLTAAVIVICAAMTVIIEYDSYSLGERCRLTTMNAVPLCDSDRKYTHLAEISPELIAALLVAEDKNFLRHNGFDFRAMRKALQANLQSGNRRFGASTITQQVTKNVFLYEDRTLWRKLREAWITVLLEVKYPKSTVIETYFNIAEFGEDLFGISAASEYYYQKTPVELDLLESVLLVRLLPNPVMRGDELRSGVLSEASGADAHRLGRRLRQAGFINQERQAVLAQGISEYGRSGSDTIQRPVLLVTRPEGFGELLDTGAVVLQAQTDRSEPETGDAAIVLPAI